jgi:hypothetical protein
MHGMEHDGDSGCLIRRVHLTPGECKSVRFGRVDDALADWMLTVKCPSCLKRYDF